jgi:hypothetical protein
MGVFEGKRIGLREMPSNVAWLLSRLVTPADETDLVASPAGDSLEVRAKRARAAAERAEDAQERAVEAAREYEALADHLREVVERGQARIEEIDRETSERVRHRVAEAQKAAEEFVRRERQEAENEADAQRQEVEEELEDEMVEVENEAEAALHRAEELVADAAHALAEARRLAAEAAEVARLAAAEAERKAHLIQDGRGDAAEELRKRAAASANKTAREFARTETNGLEDYKKTELVELAAGIGIKGRAGMTKGELVDAIMNAARGRARETSS